MTVIGVSFSRWCGSWHELADGMDVGSGAADREHLDRGSRRDRQGLVVGTRRPDLTAELDPAGVLSRDLLGHQTLQPDQLVVTADQGGAWCSRATRLGRTSASMAAEPPAASNTCSTTGRLMI